MNSPFKDSQTKDNLLRAFAGESQARNRYVFAASQAKKSNLHVVEAIFIFTANQEKEHAEIFYNLLKELSGSNINVDGNYPVDIYDDVVKLLRAAQHNEYQEYNHEYANFGKIAKEEGFAKAAAAFQMIAGIEKTHGDRFGRFADMLEQNKLFVSSVSTKWMCLNCGFVYEGTNAPEVCPVCDHAKGYFIRLELAPFEKNYFS